MLRSFRISDTARVELFFDSDKRGIFCSEIELFEEERLIFSAERDRAGNYDITPKAAGEDPRNRDIIERAVTMASALDQRGNSGFLAVTHDGRVIGVEDTAMHAFFEAEWSGWEGWAAHDPKPDAIGIIPMKHVKLRRA